MMKDTAPYLADLTKMIMTFHCFISVTKLLGNLESHHFSIS